MNLILKSELAPYEGGNIRGYKLQLVYDFLLTIQQVLKQNERLKIFGIISEFKLEIFRDKT